METLRLLWLASRLRGYSWWSWESVEMSSERQVTPGHTTVSHTESVNTASRVCRFRGKDPETHDDALVIKDPVCWARPREAFPQNFISDSRFLSEPQTDVIISYVLKYLVSVVTTVSRQYMWRRHVQDLIWAGSGQNRIQDLSYFDGVGSSKSLLGTGNSQAS